MDTDATVANAAAVSPDNFGKSARGSEADAQELAMRLERLELALVAERREKEEEKRVRLAAEERVKVM